MFYRDVNIALANELAAFCEVANVQFERVRAAANTDGEANLLYSPESALGGTARQYIHIHVTRRNHGALVLPNTYQVRMEINDQQPTRQIDRISALWGSLARTENTSVGAWVPAGCKNRNL